MHTGSTRSLRCSPVGDKQVYTNMHTHTDIRMTTQAQYGPWYLSATCAQTHLSLEIPATPQKAPPRVILAKPPPDALNSLWSPGPSPLLSTLSPHQAAPDSAGSGFGTCTTTPGAGEGEQAAARGAERASAPRVPGPCGLPPISHPRRPRSAQVVGAQNVGFPGAGGRDGVVPGPRLRRASRGPAQ